MTPPWPLTRGPDRNREQGTCHQKTSGRLVDRLSFSDYEGEALNAGEWNLHSCASRDNGVPTFIEEVEPHAKPGKSRTRFRRESRPEQRIESNRTRPGKQSARWSRRIISGRLSGFQGLAGRRRRPRRLRAEVRFRTRSRGRFFARRRSWRFLGKRFLFGARVVLGARFFEKRRHRVDGASPHF